MKRRTMVVFAYDIPDNRRRSRISRALEDMGCRVQLSVFEGWLTDEQLNEAMRFLRAQLDSGTDKLRVYRLCATCVKQVLTIGCAPPEPVPDFLLV